MIVAIRALPSCAQTSSTCNARRSRFAPAGSIGIVQRRLAQRAAWLGPGKLALAAMLAAALGALVSVPLMRGNRVRRPYGRAEERGRAAVRQRQRGRRDRLPAPGACGRSGHRSQLDTVTRRSAHGVVAKIRRRRGEPPGGGPAVARRPDRDRAFLDAPVRTARHGGSRRRRQQPAALARHHRGGGG